MSKFTLGAVGLIALSTLLSLIASGGGSWTECDVQENAVYNGALVFGLASFKGGGSYVNATFMPGSIGGRQSYSDIMAAGLEFDTHLDFENLQNAGDGTVFFLVVSALFNLAALVSLYGVHSGKFQILHRFSFYLCVAGCACTCMAMLIWLLLGHTASLHVPMDLFAKNDGNGNKMPGPKSDRSTGSSYQCQAAAFCFSLFALPLAFFAQKKAGQTEDWDSAGSSDIMGGGGFQSSDEI